MKITIPPEFNIADIDQFAISGSGLVGDATGAERVLTPDQLLSGAGWIAVKGCESDSNDISITFKNVKNPAIAQDTSPFVFEILTAFGSE